MASLFSRVRGRIEGDGVNPHDEYRNDPEYLPTLKRYMQELRDAYQAHDAASPDAE
ncbi:hypothetical protein PV703_04135 [Streptomyces sp. ME01-24h]|nr:hypothetical protein [Streptomyces sp. ME19-03-3]MDX3352525.1 hypothetical protein [Streptomyces sp. ME01-24h]